jgi:minor extracellular serine protease Vpr
MRRRPRRGAAVAAAAVAASALIVGTVEGAGDSPARVAARAWQAVFGERAEPAAQGEQRVLVVLAAPSLADRVAAAEKAPRPREQRRWTAEAGAAQRLLLSGLRKRGIAITRDQVFTRTFNGFSAVLTPRALAEIERVSGIAGIYPVRTVYPAATSLRPDIGEGRAPGTRVSLPGFDGAGVTVALLDTGVNGAHPYLRGRVLEGFDLVDGDRDVAPGSKPGDPGVLDSHGTAMAGLVVGQGGPNGLTGVAPGARVLPIRVLGWEQAADGSYAVLGRGDLLLAGLERAVDPNRDGVVLDRAAIALAPVIEPFAAFVDSPEARAVAGAARLGTLVVAPTGNEGPGGAAFGALGAPGAAPDALTVGAVDARADVLQADARLSAGDDEVLAESLRVLGTFGPESRLSLPVVALAGPTLADPERRAAGQADGSELGDFFDRSGASAVAGRAALLSAQGGALEQRIWNAAAAGAAAVLVHGSGLPAGALDFEGGAALPVLALPEEAGREALEALRSDESVTLTLNGAVGTANPGLMHVAGFSSGGVAFDGRVKPDVVAPGVGLATAGAPAGDPYATVTGTSAAAAVAAGGAALVAQARPELSALELKSVLAGSAGQLSEEGVPFPVTVQGAGLLDPQRAAAAELAVGPTTLAFGRAGGPGWSATRLVTVRNVSRRPLEVGFGVAPEGEAARELSFSAAPTRLTLAPGEAADVQVRVGAGEEPAAGAAGTFVVGAEGAEPARVPWAIAPRPTADEPLVGDVRISHHEFSPSDAAPVVLAFRVGRVDAGPDGDAVEPAGLLELELWTAKGERLGVLARLRDVLPGRYAFGLTGRDPQGRVLAAGSYVLRLRAHAVDGEDGQRPATAEAAFTIRQ